MVSFTVIVLLLLWLTQVVFLEDIYKSIKEKELSDTAKEVRLLSHKPIYIESDIYAIAEKRNVCIVGYKIESNRTATKIVDCDIATSCAVHSFTVSDVINVYNLTIKSGNRHVSSYYFDHVTQTYLPLTPSSEYDGPEMLIYSFITKDSRGNDMVFLLNTLVSPVDATVKTLNYLILIIGGIMT